MEITPLRLLSVNPSTMNIPRLPLPSCQLLRLLCSLLLLPAIISSGLAQSQTETIEGRVQNELNGRYLNNSRITVKGTDLLTLTDEDGRFRLVNVPSGAVTLDVFYTGLERHEMTVTVSPGQTVKRNIGLSPAGAAAVKMDAFVVATSKETIYRQLRTKRVKCHGRPGKRRP